MWNNCTQYESNELDKIQNGAARIVTGATKLASIDSLYTETGWETLGLRRKTHKLTMFYKMKNGLYVHSNFAIIWMGKRELIALLSLSSWCLVVVVWLSLAVPWAFLQFVIVIFPDHTHLVFLSWLSQLLLEVRQHTSDLQTFHTNFRLYYIEDLTWVLVLYWIYKMSWEKEIKCEACRAFYLFSQRV